MFRNKKNGVNLLILVAMMLVIIGKFTYFINAGTDKKIEDPDNLVNKTINTNTQNNEQNLTEQLTEGIKEQQNLANKPEHLESEKDSQSLDSEVSQNKETKSDVKGNNLRANPEQEQQPNIQNNNQQNNNQNTNNPNTINTNDPNLNGNGQQASDHSLSDEEIEKNLNKIVVSFADYYGVTTEEAAEFIYSFMVSTEMQGGEYWLDEEGNLIFENKLTIEVKYNGRILINGVDIIDEQAEYYNLTLEESQEIIAALFEIANFDKNFTVVESEEGVLFKYSIITEITNEGMIIIDGNEIKIDEIKEATDEIITTANEKSDEVPEDHKQVLSSQKQGDITKILSYNNSLPKTGENNESFNFYIGMGICFGGLTILFYLNMRKMGDLS